MDEEQIAGKLETLIKESGGEMTVDNMGDGVLSIEVDGRTFTVNVSED